MSRRQASVVIVVVALVFLGGAGPSRAASGDLDSTFGTGGLVVTDFAPSSFARGLAIQPDGKIIAVGTASSGFTFAVARYLSNGTLDPAFGTGGKVLTTFGGGSADASAAALQPDGKIVVVGTIAPAGFCCQFGLARYNPDGSLDPSFDGDGRVALALGGLTTASSVAIQPDGKIIAAGSTFSPFGAGAVVARYNGDGSPDGAFGAGGKLVFTFGGSSDAVGGVLLQSDGRILLAGSGGPSSDFGLARLNADGTFDGTFGSAGKVTTDFGGFDRASSLVVQPDGKIVVAGTGRERFAVARYLANGSLDPSFDLDGMAPAPFTAPVGSAVAVALQSNGKIVLAGSETFNLITFTSVQDIALLRLNSDGTYDTAFGTAGIIRSDFAGADGAADMQLQSDGMIVVAGGTGPGCGNPCRFSLVRYVGDRPTDTTAPLITSSALPDPNATAWNNTDVNVGWNVSDPESGITSSSGCGPQTLTTETAGTVITCSAQNGAGLSSSASISVKIDKTVPTVAFTGNAGTYAVDEQILITCAASDALSGIATTSCPGVASGPATNYVGSTATTISTLTATATDNAGNSAAVSTTFTVTVTAEGICRLSASLPSADDICTKTRSIATAPTAGAKAGRLRAFDNFLAAKTGKSISADQATLLNHLAHLL